LAKRRRTETVWQVYPAAEGIWEVRRYGQMKITTRFREESAATSFAIELARRDHGRVILDHGWGDPRGVSFLQTG
jgi:hypothetical protein